MKFSKKTAHRLIISLSMFAPVLYLFGVMFLGLAGAHGEQIFAQPLYEEQYVQVSSTTAEGEYKYHVEEISSSNPTFSINYPFVYNGNTLSNISFTDLGNQFVLSVSSPYANIAFCPVNGSVSFVADFYFVGDWGFVNYFGGTLYKKVLVPVENVPENNSAYTELIFGNFFPRDNFLERVGVNALSAEPVGFAPFGAFLSYLDQNMLHASESQMALMIYGEVYWALHIVLADLVYHVAVFFPNLIERVFDWFGQKGLNDD